METWLTDELLNIMASRFRYKVRCWCWVTGTRLARYFHAVDCAHSLRLTEDLHVSYRITLISSCAHASVAERLRISMLSWSKRGRVDYRQRGPSMTKIGCLTVDAGMAILDCRTVWWCGDAGSRCWMILKFLRGMARENCDVMVWKVSNRQGGLTRDL